MNPPVSKSHVLELRRKHSLREVAAQTGLPLGTVKTWCSRSGAFKDNQALRALFSLPPIQQSSGTQLVVPELPPQEVVTGDKEVDAVLWLRSVIRTGQPSLIKKAMLAAKRIKTPLKELGSRYMKHLVSKNPNNWTVAFQTIGFEDLEELANKSVVKLTRQHEAISRFGSIDNLFANTPAEEFCINTLRGLKVKKGGYRLDDEQVDKRFQACPDLMPQTLSDCLHERAYWTDLYWLRHAASGNAGDPVQESQARDDFVFRNLARIRSKSKEESIAVFRHMAGEYMNRDETEGILINLMR